MPDFSRPPNLVLLLETSLEYGRALLRGVSRYTRLHGPWSLQVEPGHFRHARQVGISSEYSGVIARITSAVEAEAIAAANCPAVVLEPSFGDPAMAGSHYGFHEIWTDSPAIARVAADHLRGLGLKHFAYCGFANCPWSEVRQQVFISQIEAQGFTCSVFSSPSPLNREHDAHLLQEWLLSLTLPAGLMACNDMCGRQVLNACAEAGIAVPDQLAVIGVDNDELLCELANPPLSSVELKIEQAGYDAAQLLDQILSGKRPEGRRIIKVATGKVVVRRSTEPVIEEDALVAAARRLIRDGAGRLTGVPEVAAQLKVSRRTLERSFLQALGHGVYEEITRCRLARAKRLLEETDLPAFHVAESAGFGGIQPMMRLFRKRENRTPLEYRRHVRGQDR